MTVAPLDLDTVTSYEGHMDRTNTERDRRWIQQPPTGQLLDALRTLTGKPEVPRGKELALDAVRPLEPDALVTPGNGIRHLDGYVRNQPPPSVNPLSSAQIP
jgi:hypothetical protein